MTPTVATIPVADLRSLPPPDPIRIPARAGLQLGGWFFSGGEGRRVCVVLAHGFGASGVHMLEPFARRFQAAGRHAIAFDYRGFGASEGEPRQLVSPGAELEDLESVLAYARARPELDADRIVLWGVSYGGGVVVEAAARDPRVAAAIALVPMMDIRGVTRDTAAREGWGWVARATLAAARDLARAALGKEPLLLPVVGPPGSLAVITAPGAEAGYLAAVGPGWVNAAGARIFLTGARFRPVTFASRVRSPVLFQIADRDTVVPVDAIERAAALARDRATVVRYPLDHFDVFGGPGFDAAAADQIAFLREHLPA